MRKITAGLFILALLTFFLPSPSLALNLAPGDLIKTAGNPTVYYYGYDGKRHAFPLERVYFSWYADFSNVKTISQGDLASITLGSNITVRPGTYMVKLITDPKVYVIEPEGLLKHLTSVVQASSLYGATWQSRVIDLPDAFYGDYKDGGELSTNRHPTGTIFRYQGEPSYYLLTNGYARKFISTVYWNSYHFNNKFIMDLAYQDWRYRDGANIDQYQVALADTAQTLIGDEASNLINYCPAAGCGTGVGRGNGLLGDYYTGKNFTTKVIERVDSQINFDWSDYSPAAQLPDDDYSVRWTGKIDVPSGGTVTFYTYNDDGARLYLDNSLVVDDWNGHYAKWNQGSVYLNSGKHDIRVEYFQIDLDAVMKLYWDIQIGASNTCVMPTGKSYCTYLIPQGQLYSK